MKFIKKNPVQLISRLASSTSTDKELPSVVNLTIVRLDGEEYKVQVGRNATVAKVKKAVEDVFAGKQVRWPYVWSYFCLLYKDYYELLDGELVNKEYKLIDDKDRIRSTPIEDGARLYFVPHRVPSAACLLEYRRPRRNRVF